MSNNHDDIRAYKPFVDGLRAIAILTVVGSHLELPGLLGGYVGVDIFFVISGYLIINQIKSDIDRNRFSLLDFAARRALRILPAFLLVLVTCLLLVTAVFIQPEYKDFAETFLLSAMMLVNHHFLPHQAYFDMAAFTKPLLHMWSLAVEEQFYVLAPATLLGIAALASRAGPLAARRIWIGVAAGLAAISFAACVAFTYPLGIHSNTAFYAMPMRGWEFILGGIAPSLVPRLINRPRWIGDGAALCGAAAIVAAVTLYNSDTLFPSYRAALPACGAMLVIAGGLANPRNIVARALASAPMVGIGLVSYSWYLWHWPMISFVRTTNFGARDLLTELGAVALSFVLAVLTYRLVEAPIRRWRRSRPLRPALVTTAGVAACMSIGLLGYSWAMWAGPRMLPVIAGLTSTDLPRVQYPPVAHRGVLLGDSHASLASAQLQERARREGAELDTITSMACPPLLNTSATDHLGQPLSYCEPFFKKIAFDGAEFAIVMARWNYYLGLPPSDPFYRSLVLVEDGTSSKPADPYGVLAKGLAVTIAASQQARVKRILVVGPLPEFPAHPPYCLMRLLRVGVDGCTIKRASVDARRGHTMATLARTIAGVDGLRLVDPIGLFCNDKTCQPHEGRTLYFRDSNHLSAAGFDKFYEAYESDFRWAMTGR